MKCKGPKWVKAWISQMAMLNDQFRDDEGKIDFLALGKEEYQYRMALIQGRLEKSERAKDAYEEALSRYSANVSNGSKGGRPRKTQSTTATQESSKNFPDTPGGSASPAESAAGKRTPRTAEGSAARSLPPSTAELYDFAEAARLSESDAREWWGLCTERGWKDRSGKPIRNWKKACERYCARRAINRMAKGET